MVLSLTHLAGLALQSKHEPKICAILSRIAVKKKKQEKKRKKKTERKENSSANGNRNLII